MDKRNLHAKAKIAVVALTPQGTKLAAQVGQDLGADLYCLPENAGQISVEPLTVYLIQQKFSELIGEIFTSYQAMICIMACGIVVRLIAPYLENKRTDPAIVVLDEQGRFAISLSAGHLGGANQLARQIAALTGGEAVITTATDLNDRIAFDLFAQANNCQIEDEAKLKMISAALLRQEPVHFFTDCQLQGGIPSYLESGKMKTVSRSKYAVLFSNSTAFTPIADHTLVIRPRNLILGIGCRRGVSLEAVAFSIRDLLARYHKSLLAVKALASIEFKEQESGIVNFCVQNNLPLLIFTAEEIDPVAERFVASPFVKQTVGVGSVAEPCALLGGTKTRLLAGKTIYPGITLALAEEERVYCL